MKYCINCGEELTQRECINYGINEGYIPYCPKCEEYRFERFNTAVSAVVYNPKKTKILLIRQYGRSVNILPAGYVTKGENLREALIRELKEELDIEAAEIYYNDSEYYKKSESLICNFIVISTSERYELSEEVDYAKWYDIETAKEVVYKESLEENLSLAHKFLYLAVERLNGVMKRYGNKI